MDTMLKSSSLLANRTFFCSVSRSSSCFLPRVPVKLNSTYSAHRFLSPFKAYGRNVHLCAASSCVVSSPFSASREAKEPPEFLLYNTMTREKERFRPLVAGKVGMYVCGITPYDYSHIGHARVYVSFDILFRAGVAGAHSRQTETRSHRNTPRAEIHVADTSSHRRYRFALGHAAGTGAFDRYLMHLGYEVKYVRNFTDVDDKIIARASQLGEDPIKLSDRFCEEFHADMKALQCLPATAEPRVTSHIESIIKLIEQIVKNGYGYVLEEGDVYFSVDNYVMDHPSYGRLSGRSLDENRAGERVAVDKRKRNLADFALWKSAKPGEPSWKSPWGPGRPGWHIECSAMSAEHLGPCFDIHGGGMDLIFPHHENEIAQSCAACRESRVQYWMHNGFVTVDSEKMSKSLGNFFTIREVLGKFHPSAIRLFLIGTHYRSPINYSISQLERASDRAYYIYQTLEDCAQALTSDSKESAPLSEEGKACVQRLRQSFECSMSDDLLTPAVLSALSEPLKVMNDLLHTRKGLQDKSRVPYLKALQGEVSRILDVFGLVPSNSLPEILNELKFRALKRANLTSEDVDRQIQERAAARSAKDYAKSDLIRHSLASQGIALMDNPEGTTWRPCIPLET